MTVLIRVITTLAFLFFSQESTSAADLSQSLQQYFSGSAVQFGYGSGTSSNNPRVELTIHYCASGFYHSSGQSCRPNLIASGYQCTPMQDAGRGALAVGGAGRASSLALELQYQWAGSFSHFCPCRWRCG